MSLLGFVIPFLLLFIRYLRRKIWKLGY
jgi:hypothetical protein